MSEVDTPRNDAGQFTPDTSNLYGREYELVSNGFTVKEKEPEQAAVESSDPVRQAAAELAARRAAPENISVVELKNMTDFEAKEARTIEEAGAEYAHSRNEVAKFAEGLDLSLLANKVDDERAKVIKNDPKVAKEFGFELEDGAKAEANSGAKEAGPIDDQVDAATAAAIDAVEGLDETTKRALKIPQVRAAIEQQLGEVDTARQQLATERALAQQFAQASFMEGFPELAGLPPQHLEAGLQQLAQQNPQRFQQAMGILGRVQALQESSQQAQAAQAHEHRQQIETWAKTQDARLKSLGVEFTPETVNAVTEYAKEELAIDRQQLAEVMLAHPILRSAEFQRVMHDAAQYRRIKAAPKAVPQGLPSVQRPGVTRDIPRSGDNSSKLQSLQRQLATAKGEKAARIAGQIRSLKRAQ